MLAPSPLRRFVRSVGTSTTPIVATADCGDVFLKLRTNPQGSRVLVADYVGTRCAQLLGLQTFRMGIWSLSEDDRFIAAPDASEDPSPALVTAAEHGTGWGGGDEGLRDALNREDLAGLVVLDTWILNRDRFCPDPTFPRGARVNAGNVFLAGSNPKALRILAIDHGEAFRLSAAALTSKISHIESVKSEEVRGMFPAFGPHVATAGIAKFVGALSKIKRTDLADVVAMLPAEWDADAQLRLDLTKFLDHRRDFLTDEMVDMYKRYVAKTKGAET